MPSPWLRGSLVLATLRNVMTPTDPHALLDGPTFTDRDQSASRDPPASSTPTRTATTRRIATGRRPASRFDMIDPSLRLRRAIRSNDALLAKRILKSHPHLLHNPDHSATGDANSNLHLAASLGHTPICKLLVELGHENEADGSLAPALNDTHQTALMLASAAGHTETVHFLCEHNPNSILRQDVRGRDAIMEASLNGHDTVVQLLLTFAPGGAATALAQADVDGNTALHFASSNGNLLVLRTLLAAGADAGRKNVWNWTAEAYSATVQAEVYLKGLVAEVERRKQAWREAEGKKGGGVRIVDEGGD